MGLAIPPWVPLPRNESYFLSKNSFYIRVGSNQLVMPITPVVNTIGHKDVTARNTEFLQALFHLDVLLTGKPLQHETNSCVDGFLLSLGVVVAAGNARGGGHEQVKST